MDLRKISGRRSIRTIDNSHAYVTMTDMRNLFAYGREGCLDYISSGFKVLPRKLKFRTDNAEAEAEALPETDREAIIEESEPVVEDVEEEE